jgi:hypothetical protein
VEQVNLLEQCPFDVVQLLDPDWFPEQPIAR